MRGDDGLEIPESNREIALHMRAIRTDVSSISERLDTLENSVQARRFKLQDIMVSALLLPIVGGMIIFLLTKALS